MAFRITARIFTIVSLVFVCLNLYSQPKKVLFLGNSYTGYNNLPKLVHDVSLSAGDSLIYDDNVVGGARLMTHVNSAVSQMKIASENWDYVVLQAQSREPSLPIEIVEEETFPYARKLSQSIRNNDNCSRPLFYLTWGRENGDYTNCSSNQAACTYEGMDDLLRMRYETMAQRNEGYISPVGAVWRFLRKNHPDIMLYAGDESHPGLVGSYAAACTFYSIIFQKDPTEITFNFGLSDSLALLIKNAAKEVAFNNLEEWNVGKFDPKADFTYSQSGDTIAFFIDSDYYDSFNWEFGDGGSSSTEKPVHIYSSDYDSYEASLVVNSCGLSDTIIKTINLNTTSTSGIENAELYIYPNPSSGHLFLVNPSDEQVKVSLTDSNGKYMLSKINPSHLELNNYSNGVYFLLIENLDTQKLLVEKLILAK